MWPLSGFQYGFRSSHLIVDFLTIVFNRIFRAFNRFGDSGTLAFDIC